MRHTVIGFGLLIFSLLVLFKLAGYARFRMDDGMGTWVAVFSILFLFIGIFLSRKMFSKVRVEEKQVIVEVPAPTVINQERLDKLGLSKREYEMLQLITEGLSNQQIAGRLFVSENTIKKHISNLFLKLDVQRRTEAVKKAKEMGVI